METIEIFYTIMGFTAGIAVGYLLAPRISQAIIFILEGIVKWLEDPDGDDW